MNKILIAIPSFDWNLSPEIIWFLMKVKLPKWYTKEVTIIKRTLIDVARNMAVKAAIENKFDYLFFLDDDTLPWYDVLEKLIWDNLSIVTGVYRARGGDKKIMLYEKWMVDGKPYYYNLNKINRRIGVIHKVDACGGGCLLIKTSVLKDMVKEYWDNLFELWTIPFYKWSEYRFDKQVNINDISRLKLSEDIVFCERATNMMYMIHADTRCNCLHLWENWWIGMDKAMYCDNSDIEVSVLVKDTNFNKIQKMLLDKMRLNYEIVFVDNEITQDIVDSCNWEVVMYIDDVEIPYWLDLAMQLSLLDSIITWPMTIVDNKPIFRNDNIVTHCWAMKKRNLEKIVPVPTDIKDFTIYRKIKENKWKCAILDAMIKFNG